MDIDNFSDLPEWHELSNDDDEGEEWKPNPTKELCMALYSKWKDIVFMLNGIVKPYMEPRESGFIGDNNTKEMTASVASAIFNDAHIVAVKIMSSEAVGTYVGRMENASIIRINAQSIASSLLLMLAETDVDAEHIKTLREEINAFKGMFRQWVASFTKDEFTDDWGLFV